MPRCSNKPPAPDALSSRLSRHVTELHLLAFVAVSWSYFSILVLGMLGPLELFSYLPGYVTNFHIGKFCIASLLVAGSAMVLPKDTGAASLFVWLVFFLFLIPITTVYACSDRGAALPLGAFVSFLIAVGVGLCVPCTKMRSFPSSRSVAFAPGIMKAVTSIAIVFVLGMLLVAVFQEGLSVESLNLDSVYDVRAQSTLSSGMSALMQLASLMITPILIALFLTRRNWVAAIALSVCQLGFYMATANKAWLLITVLVWGLYLVTRFSIKPLPLLVLLTAGVAVATLLTWLFPEKLLAAYSLLVRRLLILPAILRFDYFAFFQENPLVGLQGTLIGMLTPDVLAYAETDYQVLISRITWGSIHSTYANTGMFGGEFANFGFGAFLAVAVNLILLILLFRIRPRNKESQSLQCVLAVIASFILLNISSLRALYSAIGLVFVGFCIALFVCIDDSLENLPEGRREVVPASWTHGAKNVGSA